MLRPGGRFIVSTPDRDVYSPTAERTVNPFHVMRVTRLEFLTLLQSRFRHVPIMQQRAIIGSALLPETGRWRAPLVFDRRGDTHFEACAGLPRAPYLVAVASDDEPAPFSVSLYVHRSDLDTDPARILTLKDQVSRVLAALSEAAARTAEATARTAEATARAAAATEQAAGLPNGRTMRNGSVPMWNRDCVSRNKNYRRWIGSRDHCACSCAAIGHGSAGTWSDQRP